MGYRSDVGIEMTKNVFDNFKKNVLDKTEYIEPDHIYNNNDTYIVVYKWRKWYNEFPEVQAVMNFLDEVDEEDYQYIRVGEEAGDVEVLGYGNNYLSFGLDIYNQHEFKDIVNASKKDYIAVNKHINMEDIAKAQKILADNGINEDEADTVLQALGYALLNTELFPE